MPGSRRGLRMHSSPQPDRFELQFNYAWNWFQYHASQRLTAFNFFLILTSAGIVGYGNAARDHSWGYAIAIAFVGLIVAVGFLAMDIRNTELVQCGRNALDELEKQLPLVDIRTADETRSTLQEVLNHGPEQQLYGWVSKNPKRERLLTHSVWLRSIMVVIAVGFLFGLVAAGIGAARHF
jgi:hypothetical protein